MELHQLRYFVAVAKLENFSRAAESCGVTQPSLSQQIKKLENELGQPLFDRLGKTAKLTEAGNTLLEQAADILASVDEVTEKVQETSDVCRGKIVVGAIPTMAPYLLPKLLTDFSQRCPEADVHAHEDFTDPLIEACLNGDVDVGILALPVEHDQLHIEAVFEEEILLAMPSGHRFESQKDVSVDDLMDEPFILLNETHCLGEHIVGYCKVSDYRPTVNCKSAQLLTIQQLVACGRGLSLIPAMARDADGRSRVCYRSLSGDKPTRTVAMVWNRHRYQSRLLTELLETIRTLAPS